MLYFCPILLKSMCQKHFQYNQIYPPALYTDMSRTYRLQAYICRKLNICQLDRSIEHTPQRKITSQSCYTMPVSQNQYIFGFGKLIC